MTFFQVTHQDKDSLARTGIIQTAHGEIQTPVFMPVGTQATVKSLDSNDISDLDTQIILANTYHLHLRPGEDIVAKLGGLHEFMNWHKPILTDSGGFQVFSLGDKTDQQGKLVKITANGVTFRSHLDGSKHQFTPESAIEIQHKLGADIIMAFDECTADDAKENYVKEAMERTHHWAQRCLDYHNSKKTKQHLFGIIQGANYENLRKESAEYISSLDFAGIAIGGASVGFNMPATKQILDWVNPIIPQDKPHYTMGVGFSPTDLFDVVAKGVDMFDCVSPTRMARNGSLFVHKKIDSKYRINILNARYKEDKKPIDPNCTCTTCQNYSRGYLQHLFKAEELLAYRLSTIHNLHFFSDLMKQIREAIQEDRFDKLKKEWN